MTLTPILPGRFPSRPLYKTAADAAAELAIADYVAQWAKAQFLRVSVDTARIDGLLHRDGCVVAFLEIKCRSCRFGIYADGWIVSEAKVIAMRALHNILGVPVALIASFICGTIASVDSEAPYQRIENFGRYDRGDPADVESGACYRWQDLFIIRFAFPQGKDGGGG